MISLEHLSKQYGVATVVDDVSMQIERNSITVIVGTSGSPTRAGKSAGLTPLYTVRIRLTSAPSCASQRLL